MGGDLEHAPNGKSASFPCRRAKDRDRRNLAVSRSFGLPRKTAQTQERSTIRGFRCRMIGADGPHQDIVRQHRRLFANCYVDHTIGAGEDDHSM